jgi:glycosyltransferase involved in cell wall biosynthesis
MTTFDRYINKNIPLPKFIKEKPEKSLKLCVIVPCYNEAELLATLESLYSCTPTKSKTEVIVVLNSSEDSQEYILANNKKTFSDFNSWKESHSRNWLDFHVIEIENVPRKHAGVGRARKIGMDEAVRRFKDADSEDGIIISLDADCIVEKNYLLEIEKCFQENHNHNFFTISFAHPTSGADISPDLMEGITYYELYMRYYRHALLYCGFPHAIYSLGSCFTVKASAYAKQGGMNSRKAGEDFYFLQKMISLGGTYGEIKSTRVFPGTRISNRVPFGTGPALKKWTEGEFDIEYTYNLKAFEELRFLFSNIKELFTGSIPELKKFSENLPPALHEFIKENNTIAGIIDIRNNCSGIDIFEKRLFHFINAFWILKYLNFAHLHHFKKRKLVEESSTLLQKNNYDVPSPINPTNLLHYYRNLDNTIDI